MIDIRLNLRVLYIAPAANPHSIRWIESLYATERVAELNVTWITFERPAPKETFSGTNIYIDYIYLPRDLFRLFFLSSRYDYCHIQSLARYLIPLLFIETRKIKLILTGWGSDIYITRKNWIVRLLQNMFLPRATALTGDSKEMCMCLEKISRGRPTHRINFGTDCTVYRPDSPFFGFSDKSVLPNRYILSTRNFHSVYDLKTLVKAYSKLSDSERNAYPLVLVGKGPEREDLLSLAETLGISHNLIMPGYLPFKELPGVYSNCTAYVSTSLSDAGLAASTAEAMACGAIPVVTNVKENSDWVSESRGTGFLFEASDYKTLYLIIKRLLYISNKDRQQISISARSLIFSDLNSQFESIKFLDIIGASGAQ